MTALQPLDPTALGIGIMAGGFLWAIANRRIEPAYPAIFGGWALVVVSWLMHL